VGQTDPPQHQCVDHHVFQGLDGAWYLWGCIRGTPVGRVLGQEAFLDARRTLIFIAFAFGLSWAFCRIIYLTGGLVDSPQLIPGTGLTLATVLLAVGYMWSPAIANVLTRLVTREGWQDLGCDPASGGVSPTGWRRGLRPC
jgi:hypothetical protein